MELIRLKSADVMIHLGNLTIPTNLYRDSSEIFFAKAIISYVLMSVVIFSTTA